jgi:hypothetical protein
MYSNAITTYSEVWTICIGYGEPIMRGTPGYRHRAVGSSLASWF